MKTLKNITIITLLSLTSCTSWQSQEKPYRDIASIETPTNSCSDSMKHFVEVNYNARIMRALEEKQLVKRKTEKMQVTLPGRSWWQRMRKNWIQRFKNANDNKYPTYYMYDDQESVAHAVAYGKLFSKNVTGEVQEENQINAIKRVDEWIGHFTDYKKELNDLIDERISIAYNRDLLKRNKPDSDRLEVDLIYKKKGKDVPENIIFYEEDKNYQYYVNQLEKQLTGLDGGMFDWWFDEGRIKQRIIKQAILQDQVTIVHRELEYFYHNSPDLADDVKETMKAKIDELAQILDADEFKPSQYGLAKVDWKKWRKEVKQLPKSVTSNKKVTDAQTVYNEILDDKDKERVKYFTDGLAKQIRATSVGSFLGLFATGVSFRDKIVNYVWGNETTILACVEDSKKENEYFDCIFEFVQNTYPQRFMGSPLDRKVNLFDYEKVPENIRPKYKADLERAKRLWAFKMHLRDKKLESRAAFRNEVKSYYDSIIVADEDFHTCAKIDIHQLKGCIFDYMIIRFPDLFRLEKGMKFNVFDYEKVPKAFRKDYQKEVEKIMTQRTTYEDLYDQFTDDATKVK